MPPRILIIWFTVGFLLSGCGRPADTSVAQHYHGRGITFEYPAPWKIGKEVAQGVSYLILVEEPGAAIVNFTLFPAEQNHSLEEYTELYLKDLEAELRPNIFQRTGTDRSPGHIDVRFSLKFGSISLPCTVNVTRHEQGKSTVFCVTQVADEDRAGVQAAFDRMRHSLAVDPAP